MSPSALVCAPGEGNRENSRFKDVKLWLHLRDLICMNNKKTRERIFRLNFSHTRPAELSIMHLQSELLGSTTFRKGCSIVGKSVICRCLEKLEVFLRCIYSLKRQLAIVWDLDETSCDFYVESLAVLKPTHGKNLIEASPIQMRKYNCNRPREMLIVRLLSSTEFMAK